MSDSPVFLSLVIPIHNEGNRLAGNLDRTLKFMRSTSWTFEVVGVNDGSDDDSESILRRYTAFNPEVVAVSYPVNVGKGYALQQGILASRGKWVLTLDADMELPVEQVPTFLKVQQATGSQVVIGSKWHPDSHVDYPRGRRILSRGLHFIVRTLFPLRVTDSQVGIKLFQGDAVRFVSRSTLVKRFAWDIEFLLVSQLYGLTIAEAPVVLKFSRTGIGRIRISTILQVAREVMGIWYRFYIRGFYERAIVVNAKEMGMPAHLPTTIGVQSPKSRVGN